MSRRAPSVPDALPMRDALGRSDMLQHLQRRLREAAELLSVARAVLPGELGTQVSSGTLDETGWTLLARSSAAAAKLRQCLPRIEEALAQRGRKVNAIKVRVQSAHRP